MTDAEGLWASISTDHGDETAKLVLADWYGENDEPDVEYALRWCVARKKWPNRVGAGQCWWSLLRDQKDKNLWWCLSPVIFEQFRPRTRNNRVCFIFDDYAAAVRALAVVLAQLRAAVEAAPEPQDRAPRTAPKK